MKDTESVKDYFGRLMDVVNQVRLLGETFMDENVVEKIMVSVPQKFESTISAIEESDDMKELTIAEITSKLHAQEQRVSIRGDVSTEGAFRANPKGTSEGLSRKGIFSPCSHYRRTNHIDKDCWYKDKPFVRCNFCKKLGHNEKYCRSKTHQANMGAEDENNDENLLVASQSIGSHELNTWLIDSGCTSHITRFLSIFTSIDTSVQ